MLSYKKFGEDGDRKIHVLSFKGDVDDQRTWSGTPFNLSRELGRLEALGHIENNESPSLQYRVFDSILKRAKGRFPSLQKMKGCITQRKEVNEVARFCRKHSKDPVLLMSISHFPVGYGLKNCSVLVDYLAYKWLLNSTGDRFRDQKKLESLKKWEMQCYVEAQHVFTLGKYCRDEIVDEFGISGQKISAIGGGVSPEWKSIENWRKDFSSKKILFLAKGSELNKGVELVVEAFKLIKSRDPSSELTLAGSDFYQKYSSMDPSINVRGFLDPSTDAVRNIYRDHNVFIMPSPCEPWGFVYLEAMSSGLIPVGPNRNAFPEMTKQGEFGIMLKEQSAECIAQSLFDAFEDENRLLEMSRLGREYVIENFTWERASGGIVSALL